MDKKNILILDNDWTLSKFKNWNFSNTIWYDLKSNIKDYISDILSFNEYNYNECIKWIKNNSYDLSEWFEKLWVNRKKYFHETWKYLNPEDYIVDRWNRNLRKLIEYKKFKNIMITWAPKIWFQNSILFLWYDLELFNEIYTAENFYAKKQVNLDIFNNQSNMLIKKSISIWDEVNDFIHLQKLWWIWIDINKSKIYK